VYTYRLPIDCMIVACNQYITLTRKYCIIHVSLATMYLSSYKCELNACAVYVINSACIHVCVCVCECESECKLCELACVCV
jgi:hypothetical protein